MRVGVINSKDLFDKKLNPNLELTAKKAFEIIDKLKKQKRKNVHKKIKPLKKKLSLVFRDNKTKSKKIIKIHKNLVDNLTADFVKDRKINPNRFFYNEVKTR